MSLHHVLATLRARRRLFLIMLGGAAVVLALIAVFFDLGYSATSSVLLVAEAPTNPVVAADAATKPILSSDLPFLATTPTVLVRVAHDLSLGTDMKTLEMLRHHIKASLSTPPTPISQTPGALLIVTFKGRTPERTVAGANAVAHEVSNFYRDRATLRFRLLIADLRKQMTDKAAEINRTEAGIQQLAAANPFLVDKQDETSLGAQYERLVAERSELSATVRGDVAASDVVGGRPQEVSAAARRDVFESDPTLQSLRRQYAQDFARLALERAQFSATYPGLPELEHVVAADGAAVDAHIATLEKTQPIAASLAYANAQGDANHARSIAASDEAKLTALDRVLRATQSRLKAARAATSAFDELSRQHEVQAASYTALAARLTEASGNAAEAGSVGSAMTLDRAIYARPVPYSLPIVRAALVMLLSIGFAIAGILLVERFDRRLRAVTIERIYGLPVVATLSEEKPV